MTKIRSRQADAAVASVIRPMAHPEHDIDGPQRRDLGRYFCSPD
jgi:hypothetical protein